MGGTQQNNPQEIRISYESLGAAVTQIKEIAESVYDLKKEVKQLSFSAPHQSTGHCAKRMESISQECLPAVLDGLYTLMRQSAALLTSAIRKYRAADQHLQINNGGR